MARLRLTGQVYHADEQELHTVRKFDFFSDVDCLEDVDINLPPSADHVFTAADYGAMAWTTVQIFSDYDITVTVTSGDESFAIPTHEALLIQRTTLDAVTITNPSTTITIKVKVVLGGI